LKTVKPRCLPRKLSLWRSLNTRMRLEEQEKKYYANLEKGFAGEMMFDALLENIQDDRLLLNDLLFETNNTTFQIDSFCISQNTIYHFEVKNYEGDHYFELDHFYTSYRSEIQNPVNQLNRSSTLLRQLFKSIGCTLLLESYVVFINPEFFLYQAPLNLPIIYPTQLNRFLKELNSKSSKLTSMHLNLAEKVTSLHQIEDPYHKSPSYQYEQLHKGIICGPCGGSFMLPLSDKKLICGTCGCVEDVDSAILRSIEEFKLLFPDRAMTTSVIYEWCGKMASKRQVHRILLQNFKSNGYGKWTYYE
jgi:ribosomal protein S27AE